MHYNLSGMLRVAFVLLLIRFTLATFQLRIQFSFGLRPIFPRPFIKSGLTSNALCLFWRLLQWPKPPLPPHFPPRFHSSSCCPFFFGCSLCFCRVIFNSFTFCTSALCVTNCFCVAVFTIVLIHFLSSPKRTPYHPWKPCCLIKCTLNVLSALASRPLRRVLSNHILKWNLMKSSTALMPQRKRSGRKSYIFIKAGNQYTFNLKAILYNEIQI